MNPFDIARLPQILFGAGRANELPRRVAAFGERVLLVTGGRSLERSGFLERLLVGFRGEGIEWQRVLIDDEPSPQLVDEAVECWRSWSPRVVLGIGGGSVLDGAKAIAGLLPHDTKVLDHLEGVGRGLPYSGPATPLIAVPTTAGTGSEATKNAVLSVRGKDGYKKSFRHDELVPRLALVDPEFLASCPPSLMAAQGMDAFTQLLESYVSIRSNPMTDALAWSGMEAFADGFFQALDGDPSGHLKMAYCSLQSGICLAQTGLGSVHGLASPLGAAFPIPHGVVCGTLLAEATDINIQALRVRDQGNQALPKYARVGAMLSGSDQRIAAETGLELLVARLREWTERLEIAHLSEYGMTAERIDDIVANSRGGSMQTNPLVLTDQELAQLLQRRL